LIGIIIYIVGVFFFGLVVQICLISKISKHSVLAITEIKEVASSLNLPKNIGEDSEKLFNDLLREGIAISHSAYCAAFACLFYVMKQDIACIAVSVKEFVRVLPLDKIDKPRCVWKAYKKIIVKKKEPPRLCTLRPMRFIDPIGQKLLITREARKIAEHIAEDAVKQNVHIGKHSVIVAAVCLYMATIVTGERRTQRQIADCAGITTVPMTNMLKHSFFENYDCSKFSKMHRSIEYYYS